MLILIGIHKVLHQIVLNTTALLGVLHRIIAHGTNMESHVSRHIHDLVYLRVEDDPLNTLTHVVPKDKLMIIQTVDTYRAVYRARYEQMRVASLEENHVVHFLLVIGESFVHNF